MEQLLEEFDFYKKIINFNFVEEIYLYGSRARGNYQDKSDIDMAIVCPQANNKDWDNLLKVIEQADTLLKIDMIRFDQLKEESPLRQAILKDKKIIYKRKKYKMDKQLDQNFNTLEKALKALKQMVDKPSQEDRSNIDAAIQRFEFTFELFWKLLKKILLVEGLEVAYPRETLQTAYLGGLINDDQIWINMLNDRNQTSHTYDEELADKIYQNIKLYYPIMDKTFGQLKKRIKSN